ncbi:origin recognition complex subunit 1 isoform X2 [Apis dorsata]|uniref:origin recognition complex subunit 1 isoform X2 n=1 Tax=Apis dorsata TaxID=7462 RepID=UPI0003DF5FA6|nr:origin recognition complex subunit 1 isoform X2 [Apis dorsata]
MYVCIIKLTNIIMAFSFRIGTKWCHDFPKLAKESGFYFNMHRSRIRVDWNRISNIDIDRIIKERDFHSIDENINNVIDYCLESEYDVKILDPNFVKLFCLAQLAVEYLLYCKQYLDHSVMILKDELKLKIEENVKLKKEIATLEEIVKHMKEKVKEKSKLIETKIGDTNGEIYKCPHCPKSFISSMFVSAHIIRRHTYTSDLYMSVSPIHEHYRNETEKLHNEIKNLKERLNETEKVIRNESERICDKKILNYNKKQTENEIENLKYDNNKSKEHSEYKEYQEEIKNLKIMLFDEIHNLRQKENIMYERTSETNVQALISQQEKEFQKLKNQLLDKFTPDIESMHTKLYDQENYWKSKIEQLENQHHKDIERLTTELKLTQNAADDMKAKYEAKVNDLERQTANQSNILIEQSKQLSSLSHEINISQLNVRNKDSKNNSLQKCSPSIILDNEISKKSDENNLKQSCVDTTIEQIVTENNAIGTTITSNLSSKVFPLTIEDSLKDTQILNSKNKFIIHENKRNIKQKYEKIPDIENFDHIKIIKKDLEYYSSSNISDLEDSILEEENNSKHKKYDQSIIKMDLHKSDISKLENVINKNISNDFLSDIKNIKTLKSIEENLSSVTNSESFISNSSIDNDTTIHNDSSLHKYKIPFSLKSKKITEHNYKNLQANLMDVFEQKLKDLGIDPEWQGIPKTTFKQKMDILKHHHKLAIKKLPKYHQIKLKIIEEVLNKISRKEKIIENMKLFKNNKKSSLHRPIIKELSNQNPDSHISTLQAITLKEYYSTPETKDSIKNITENESLSIKTQTANYKTVEELIDISSNSIKSLESIQDTTNLQEFLIKKDFLNEMKPVFNSETFKVISNNKTISNYKSTENNDINNSNIQQELQNIFISPKHNKSVLKSTTGSTNSLIKKKVIFDLTNKKDKESYSDDDKEKKELYENTLSNSDERKYLSQLEDYKNSSNIILKTAQSDKIAELSKKLEIQLNMVRQKPIGSVETIFSSKCIQNKKNQNKSIEQINPTSISSFVINPGQMSLAYTKKPNDLSQPASYNLTDKMSEILHTESVSEISDLDSDIDKILKLE